MPGDDVIAVTPGLFAGAGGINVSGTGNIAFVNNSNTQTFGLYGRSFSNAGSISISGTSGNGVYLDVAPLARSAGFGDASGQRVVEFTL